MEEKTTRIDRFLGDLFQSNKMKCTSYNAKMLLLALLAVMVSGSVMCQIGRQWNRTEQEDLCNRHLKRVFTGFGLSCDGIRSNDYIRIYLVNSAKKSYFVEALSQDDDISLKSIVLQPDNRSFFDLLNNVKVQSDCAMIKRAASELSLFRHLQSLTNCPTWSRPYGLDHVYQLVVETQENGHHAAYSCDSPACNPRERGISELVSFASRCFDESGLFTNEMSTIQNILGRDRGTE